jgi:hypothetical protein
MKKGDKIYCIDESSYEIHISKRNLYEINEIGVGTKEGKVRIKSNAQKLVWIPDSCFTNKPIPGILSIIIDDEIKDESNSSAEVTIHFNDGKKYWTTFMTIKYAENLMSKKRIFLSGEKLILTTLLNKQIVEQSIYEMDRLNDLSNQLNEY